MLIQLSGDVGKRYRAFLKTFEVRYGRTATAPERFQAYQCAVKNILPPWNYF